MKIILEFPGDTVQQAMTQVRAFAEAWANVYANAALPAGRQATKEETLAETRRLNPYIAVQGAGLLPYPAQAWAEQTVQEAFNAASVNNNVSFLDEVSELEQREDLKPTEKPAPKPANPVRRKQVEAAFRAMIDKYKVGPDDGPATQAGRAVLKHIGATSVPAIPEAKLAECLALLNISDCYHTAGAFIERLQSHDA